MATLDNKKAKKKEALMKLKEAQQKQKNPTPKSSVAAIVDMTQEPVATPDKITPSPPLTQSKFQEPIEDEFEEGSSIQQTMNPTQKKQLSKPRLDEESNNMPSTNSEERLQSDLMNLQAKTQTKTNSSSLLENQQRNQKQAQLVKQYGTKNCPTCFKKILPAIASDREVVDQFRGKIKNPNAGRIYFGCFDCRHCEWADGGGSLYTKDWKATYKMYQKMKAPENLDAYKEEVEREDDRIPLNQEVFLTLQSQINEQNQLIDSLFGRILTCERKTADNSVKLDHLLVGTTTTVEKRARNEPKKKSAKKQKIDGSYYLDREAEESEGEE